MSYIVGGIIVIVSLLAGGYGAGVEKGYKDGYKQGWEEGREDLAKYVLNEFKSKYEYEEKEHRNG